jgi:hypothetical protein
VASFAVGYGLLAAKHLCIHGLAQPLLLHAAQSDALPLAVRVPTLQRVAVAATPGRAMG